MKKIYFNHLIKTLFLTKSTLVISVLIILYTILLSARINVENNATGVIMILFVSAMMTMQIGMTENVRRILLPINVKTSVQITIITIMIRVGFIGLIIALVSRGKYLGIIICISSIVGMMEVIFHFSYSKDRILQLVLLVIFLLILWVPMMISVGFGLMADEVLGNVVPWMLISIIAWVIAYFIALYLAKRQPA